MYIQNWIPLSIARDYIHRNLLFFVVLLRASEIVLKKPHRSLQICCKILKEIVLHYFQSNQMEYDILFTCIFSINVEENSSLSLMYFSFKLLNYI